MTRILPLKVDRVTLLLVTVAWLVMMTLPLLVVKPNRIAAGSSKTLLELLDQPIAGVLLLALLGWSLINLLTTQVLWRFLSANIALITLMMCLGLLATQFAVKPAIRITPASAFWIVITVFSLCITDALVHMRLVAWQRILVLATYLLLGVALIQSGLLDNLAVMREFYAREPQFWAEALRHLQLTFGSLVIALLIGLPLGIMSFQTPVLRGLVLQSLSLIQTIPSLALFGLLMAPLGWLAAQSEWAKALGISGIGVAPALIALVLYSLLPIVANTVVGLEGVSPAVREAARGMGLTRQQRLWQIEMPLAFPVILTGIRIVLVQAIGLVTVAALVGGGGLGAFVFQGLGQTSTDLVLVGALPIVMLAFVAAVVLDAIVDSLKPA
ncbi:MAG: ABC transporter permease [Thiofilum sp.]|uniref:ABC transporter permease n=1 Tax=Thiofilum sp. TaxID=2212733 RepID=UPI0025FA1242|nr:ABC transporter permease [Thiofilum sp.]MBK8454076.1 ABC transporter permease [Thiofilum sp.]